MAEESGSLRCRAVIKDTGEESDGLPFSELRTVAGVTLLFVEASVARNWQ